MSLVKVYGRHAVLEALRADASRVERVLVAQGGHGAVIDEVVREAEARRVTLEKMDRRRFDKLAGDAVHQGVMAFLSGRQYLDISELLEAAKVDLPNALLVITDEIEDPRNLGAIARCAEGAGATGLVFTAHRSAEFTPVAEKASGGAIEHLRIARVTNLVNAIDEIKAAGIWVAGLDAAEGQEYWSADFKRPMALVIGGEGKGMRRLTKERCDFLIKMPMLGKIASLNASVASGLALYEILRQRRVAQTVTPPSPTGL